MYTYRVEVDGEEVSWTSGEPFPSGLDLIYSDVVWKIEDYMIGDGYEIESVMVEDEGLVMAEIGGKWFVVDDEFKVVE